MDAALAVDAEATAFNIRPDERQEVIVGLDFERARLAAGHFNSVRAFDDDAVKLRNVAALGLPRARPDDLIRRTAELRRDAARGEQRGEQHTRDGSSHVFDSSVVDVPQPAQNFAPGASGCSHC